MGTVLKCPFGTFKNRPRMSQRDKKEPSPFVPERWKNGRIYKNTTEEMTEKKSKFIANFIKVETTKEAEEKIKEIKKKYHDARHNCIAYRVIENGKLIERASDDGEPSGTAGGPMLNILQKNNLCNVLVVVTRYFGGILLGTGGLVRAYSEATTKAIEKAEKVTKTSGIEMEVIVEYSEYEKFKYYCQKNDIIIIKTDYNENIVCKIQLKEAGKAKLVSDFETKNINLRDLKEFDKKYI